MKRLGILLVCLFLFLMGAYFWLSSQGGPEGADSTIVTTPIPVEVQ